MPWPPVSAPAPLAAAFFRNAVPGARGTATCTRSLARKGALPVARTHYFSSPSELPRASRRFFAAPAPKANRGTQQRARRILATGGAPPHPAAPQPGLRRPPPPPSAPEPNFCDAEDLLSEAVDALGAVRGRNEAPPRASALRARAGPGPHVTRSRSKPASPAPENVLLAEECARSGGKTASRSAAAAAQSPGAVRRFVYHDLGDAGAGAGAASSEPGTHASRSEVTVAADGDAPRAPVAQSPATFSVAQRLAAVRTASALERLLSVNSVFVNLSPNLTAAALAKYARFGGVSGSAAVAGEYRELLRGDGDGGRAPFLLRDRLLNRARAQYRAMAPDAAALTLRAVIFLGAAPPWLDGLAECCDLRLEKMSARGVAVTLSALRRCPFLSPPLAHLAAAAAHQAVTRPDETFAPASCVGNIVNLAALKFGDVRAWADIADRCNAQLESFDFEDLSAIASAFAKTFSAGSSGPSTIKLMKNIAARAAILVDTAASPADVISLSLALHRTKTLTADFLTFHVAPTLHSFAQSDLSLKEATQALFLLAEYKCAHAALVPLLVSIVDKHMRELTAPQLSTVAWAFALIPLEQDQLLVDLFERLAARALGLMTQFKADDIPRLAYGFSKHRVKNALVWDALFDRARLHFDAYQPRSLADLLISFAHPGGCTGPHALEELRLSEPWRVNARELTPLAALSSVDGGLFERWSAALAVQFDQMSPAKAAALAVSAANLGLDSRLSIVCRGGMQTLAADLCAHVTDERRKVGLPPSICTELLLCERLLGRDTGAGAGPHVLRHLPTLVEASFKAGGVQELLRFFGLCGSGERHCSTWRLVQAHMHRRRKVPEALAAALETVKGGIADGRALAERANLLAGLARLGFDDLHVERLHRDVEHVFDEMHAAPPGAECAAGDASLPCLADIVFARTQSNRPSALGRAVLLRLAAAFGAPLPLHAELPRVVRPDFPAFVQILASASERCETAARELAGCSDEYNEAAERAAGAVSSLTRRKRRVFQALEEETRHSLGGCLCSLAWASVALALPSSATARFMQLAAEVYKRPDERPDEEASAGPSFQVPRQLHEAQQAAEALWRQWEAAGLSAWVRGGRAIPPGATAEAPSRVLAAFVSFVREAPAGVESRRESSPTDVAASRFHVGDFPAATWISEALRKLKVKHLVREPVAAYAPAIVLPAQKVIVDVYHFEDVDAPQGRPVRSALLRTEQLERAGFTVATMHLQEVHDAHSRDELATTVATALKPYIDACAKFLQFT